MATAPNTESLISDVNGKNRTGTAVSTNIIVEVDGNAVGAIQQLSVNENRKITMIDEVGTDGHVDSVPSSSTNITGSCQRTRFDGLRMGQAFSRGWVHVKSQRIPFDIVIKDIFLSSDPNTVLITVIKNVWISKISYSYRANDFVIVEDMDWEAEDIFSKINNNNAVTNIDGARNFVIDSLNPFERAADRGDRRLRCGPFRYIVSPKHVGGASQDCVLAGDRFFAPVRI